MGVRCGAVVPASASPHIVPAPWSDAAGVDPEEAFVAALSSCQLLEREMELSPKALEVIYACTLCGGCDVTCKFTRDMEPLDILQELRNYAVKQGKGPLPGHMPAVESIRKNENVWLQPRSRRAHWARDLGLKDVTREKAEVLYFAGCTYSYNANLQKVARSTVRIMQQAGVDLGILGTSEGCCASPIMKIGMADLFREIAGKNIDTFNRLGVQKVITSCAGCFGIFQSQYPAVGEMRFEVLHSFQVLARLLQEGKLHFSRRVPPRLPPPCRRAGHLSA